MRLNLDSATFNTETLSGGGTPAWGTEMGQGEGYRFNFEDSANFLTALVYNSVPNPQTRVYCPLGKGGNAASDYEFVVASLFQKVYVNGQFVPNAKFLLLVVKKLVGANHVGRRTLKYNPRMTLDGDNFNAKAYELIGKTLGVSRDGSWFISEINVLNQDELHFTAHVLNATGKQYFKDSADRSNILRQHIKAYSDSHPFESLKSDADLKGEPKQQIFYGAPGTGKSHTINEYTKRISTIRTTFHPDTDYSTFVGAYKPTTIEVTMRDDRGLPVREKNPETGQLEELKDNKIIYDFVPQSFLQAYIEAWRLMGQASTLADAEPQFLVIEEINRGNCAQIFGDLFQLLDRGDSGFSDYPIKADADMKKQLAKAFKGLEIQAQADIDAIFEGRPITKQVLDGDVLLLPSNLYIWATMNTSDQSLFPIDSAFKRRWDWRYLPILDAGLGWTIAVDNLRYDWNDFLTKINEKVFDTTNSEDKKLGYFFAKAKDGEISAEKFVAKVIFYLWNDVFKDYGFEDEIFQDEDGTELSFTKFYPSDDTIDKSKVIRFLDNLNVDYYEASDEENVNKSFDKPKQNRTRYLINGQPRANGKPCPPSYILINVVSKYVADHKEASAADVLAHWKEFGGVIAENIISDAEHKAYLANGTTPKRNDYFTAVHCADAPVWVRWQGWSEIVDGEPKLNILISDLADKHTGYEITIAN